MSSSRPIASSRTRQDATTKVIDSATRARRRRMHLDRLECDNYQDDPHAALVWRKGLPKFDDADIGGNSKTNDNEEKDASSLKKGDKADRRKRKLQAQHSKKRFRKNFGQLLEEQLIADAQDGKTITYMTIRAPPSRYPAARFCVVCGVPYKYTCVQCGQWYCSIVCRDVHKETRCLKWTV